MMSRMSVLVSLLLVTTLPPTLAHALVYAEDLPILFAEDIEIVDGLAYVVADRSYIPDIPTLRILDLSDPNAPVEIGSLDTSVGAQDVEVVGGLAYITDHALGGKMRIIDVSDPAAPVEIGAFVSEFDPIDVEVVGNVAYLADWFYAPYGCSNAPHPCGSSFRVIDVSDPTAPVQISERDLNFTRDMEAVEGVVYLSGFDDLEVIDVSDPTTPVEIAVVPDVYGIDIALVDGHIYATSNQAFFDSSTGEPVGFQVIDVTDPSLPVRVGRESVTGVSVEVIDGVAYTGGRNGMSVVDVSDPTAPTRLGSIYSEDLKDLEIYSGRAYLATYDGPVKVVDLSVLETPVKVGWAAVEGPNGEPGIANDVEISDGIAYLALGDHPYSTRPAKGLSTMDVSNPAAPAPLGGINTAEAALDLELVNGLAVVAAGTGGVRVFDVTNPSAPVAAGGLALPGSTAKLEVVGTTAYAVDRGISREAFRALRIIDVSNAAAPVELGAVELTDSPIACEVPDIAVVDKLAYVTCLGLYVVDVSDPAQPTLIFGERMSLYESSIEVAGDQAYVGDNWEPLSLTTYDISDPTQPVQVSVADGGGRSILVADGYAYSAGRQGLAVHDLADPHQPALMGGYPSDRGPWRGLAIADGLIYGAGYGGLQIVDLGPEYAHTLPVEIAIRADGGSAVVNLASRGVIPVTVLGAANFDVSEIDRSTLRFGPSAAAPAHELGGHLGDLNGDGHPDLLSHYWITETGISAATENACVQGKTLSGNSFKGCGLLDVMLPPGQLGAPSLAN